MQPTSAPQFIALIPCAGSGQRAGGELPKQYQSIHGQAMVLHTLAAFAQVARIQTTAVVVAPEDAVIRSLIQTRVSAQDGTLPPVQVFPCGGATRAESVSNGLQALLDAGYSPADWVLVHDAARCLVTPEQINHLIDECQNDTVGGLLACPVADTLKSAADDRTLTTLDRTGKWAAQTPQMFRLGPLQKALETALQSTLQKGTAITDEASAIEAMGLAPKLVKSSSHNFKITYPEDFALAEAIFQSRAQSARPAQSALRIGEGWDTHQLVDQASTGRRLILGGIDIPFTKGLLGHSDADALCHAMTDALLGAAGLGDIGRHFPDTDPKFKGADSLQLLRRTAQLLTAQGWQIVNIDSTVIAQAPKLAPYINAMRSSLSTALGLRVEVVNVKAKTAEKMGPVGEGLAIETRAIALLIRAA
jgi:2-C-methyl-D-erythritol 4-phosphate cytidylyltransferase / 2-C-methyl-D-erythritol 2,4-cyclodiphosphate synthase